MRAGDLQHIEILLTAWAIWSLRDFARLGYPHQSLIHRLIREGAAGAAIKRLRAAEIPNTPAIEATEAALVDMPSPLKDAVKLRYLHLHWPSTQCAREVSMTVCRYACTLELARYWLAGRLSG